MIILIPCWLNNDNSNQNLYMCFPWGVSMYYFQKISMTPLEYFSQWICLKWKLVKNYSPIPAPNSYSSLIIHVFLSHRKVKYSQIHLVNLLEAKSKRPCIRKVSGQRLNHLKHVIRDIWAPYFGLKFNTFSHAHLQQTEVGNGPDHLGWQMWRPEK